MQEQTKIEETVDSIKDYISTRYELIILKSSDKLAHIGSNVVSYIPIVLLTLISIFMLSFGLAYYVNTLLESNFLGLFIVGGGYIVIAFILLCVRKNAVAKPFRNKIIKELFKNNNL